MRSHEVATNEGRIAIIGQVVVNLFLPHMVLGDGEGHQLVERQPAVTIDLHQLGADRAKPKPLLHHMRGDTEARRDFFRSPSARFRKLAERLELVGGVHGRARDVLVKADLKRVVRRVDDAANGFRLLDLLALRAQQLRQPAAFPDGDEIAAGQLAALVTLRLHHEVLQDAFGRDAGRTRMNSPA
ncbi:MAG: hypothetical protein NTAFB05_08450 [Nitrobacter sp.]